MAGFVSKEPVAVSDDEGNTIWIVPKMSYGIRARVADEISSMSGADQDVRLSIGLYNMALLRHNIVRWDGPAFDGKPFAPRLVDELDPDWPLLDAVLAEINTRNQARGGVEKK
jgi:hypothetical protein